jgi:outer membrane protein OmpA-like peptidoglycan-associated protein/opacity protein-like surface antigen
MASGKYLSILALTGLIATASFAQKSDAGYGWVLDSSKRSVKNMPQQNEFLNNQHPYPSKPRSMWELGVSGGTSFLFSDIDPALGYGGGVSLRKSLGHIFSVRGSYNGSINYGLDYRLRNTYDGVNGPWFNNYRSNKYVANYRNKIHQLSVDFISSLNTISHYRGNPKTNIYLLAGYSLLGSDVDVNALNASGNPYSYTGIDFLGKRSDIKSDLKDLLDDDNSDTKYESNGANKNENRDAIGRSNDNWMIRHALNLGAGIAFRITDRVNIGLEQKFTVPFDDNFDAVDVGTANDFLSATQFRLNFNLGNSSKNVLPLWWLNPNNYVYNEVNTPKHMKIPTPVLPDADGDGVTDQFDMEPNTPAGAAVDSHGTSRDTDGDGVPDYKDKEPLTARDCFPVDADGVGKCPEPPCCAELRTQMMAKPACAITSLPSVQFKSGSLSLSATSKAVLNSVAQQMNANPECKVKLTGYYKGSDKRSMQLGWDRVNTVIKYLVEQQGIAESRLIFSLSDGGDPNTVDLMGTTEEGPNSIPAPFPNLQKSK